MATISRSKTLVRVIDGGVASYFPADVGGLLRLKAAAPIKPRKPQAACDIGLFSDEADQLDLCEMFQDQPEDGL